MLFYQSSVLDVPLPGGVYWTRPSIALHVIVIATLIMKQYKAIWMNMWPLCFRWFRCPRKGRAVNTSWLVPCAWRHRSSWVVAGAPECAPGRASVTVAGGTSRASRGSLGWGLFYNAGYTCLLVQLMKTFHFKVALCILLYWRSSFHGLLLLMVKQS